MKSCLDRWTAAVATASPDEVLKLYHADAVLLPTLSNQPHQGYDELRIYFNKFLAKKPQCEILKRITKLYGDIAIQVGTYQFTMGDGSVAQARYSYVYHKSDGEWQIVEHHSSLFPE